MATHVISSVVRIACVTRCSCAMLCMMPAVAFCIRSAYHSSCSGTQSASKESPDASEASDGSEAACSSAAPRTAAAAAATSCMMDVGVRHGGVWYQGDVGSGESGGSRAERESATSLLWCTARGIDESDVGRAASGVDMGPIPKYLAVLF